MAVQIVSGVSGPLLDTFFVRCALNRRRVVSTKAAVQTLSHALRIACFGALLAESGQSLGAGLALVLVMSAIVGITASKLVLERITDTDFRRITQQLVLILGSCYVLAGLWLLR
jgi:uncharacterized membrane protein YfcA